VHQVGDPNKASERSVAKNIVLLLLVWDMPLCFLTLILLTWRIWRAP